MGILGKTKGLLVRHADKVGAVIDKAAEFVDDTTQGKHSDTVHTVADEAKRAAGSVASAVSNAAGDRQG